jgi:hypothetical protein
VGRKDYFQEEAYPESGEPEDLIEECSVEIH